jgi:hypothetical protein
LLGETNSSLALAGNTAGLTNYSLMVSNCAGVATNAVADLLRLRIERPSPAGPVFLIGEPIKTSRYLVERATNAASAPLHWEPFLTVEPNQPLALELHVHSPAGLTKVLFRARPAP